MSKEIVQREGGDVMGELGTGDAARAMDEFLLAVIDAASAARRRMAGGRAAPTAPETAKYGLTVKLSPAYARNAATMAGL